ncbi:MAG: putative glycosyltransferase EpsJ [Candidatus Ordinivivax streblomastigis]|uniref:Putative glycosyltransferase EpsJ n=1 Tax=Candidatus Ordinivivax streblomastigis TaxID=2540710 RepID=A0A5M8P5C1_9BACT|nr:MAG: putative glycosyltransferase EpsJ [Candidatus Ordinivivax streblomastigis]
MDKCVLSIVNQTYSNLEILLIDDGSTDETGTLCDTWKNKDERIRVIHKQNEGSSYARKTGVENATGQYITFVDSDDWIDIGMYANMMTALLNTDSDIAQCGVCGAFEDGRIKHRTSEQKNGTFEIVGHIEGVLLLLEDKHWQSYMWNKIYKKKLFDTIEFPKGRGLDEDLTIAHHLFHDAAQSVYLPDEYYFYYHRSNSICNANTTVSQMKNCYDRINARYERYLFVAQHPEYHAMLVHVKNIVFSVGIAGLRNMVIYPQYFPDNYFNEYSKLLNAIAFSYRGIDPNLISPLKRIELCILRISPKLYKLVISFTKKLHVK